MSRAGLSSRLATATLRGNTDGGWACCARPGAACSALCAALHLLPPLLVLAPVNGPKPASGQKESAGRRRSAGHSTHGAHAEHCCCRLVAHVRRQPRPLPPLGSPASRCLPSCVAGFTELGPNPAAAEAMQAAARQGAAALVRGTRRRARQGCCPPPLARRRPPAWTFCPLYCSCKRTQAHPPASWCCPGWQGGEGGQAAGESRAARA